MKTEIVQKYIDGNTFIKVIVTKTRNWCYDGTQHEDAIFAHEAGKHGKWYVGYGGDYIPATKADVENILNNEYN